MKVTWSHAGTNRRYTVNSTRLRVFDPEIYQIAIDADAAGSDLAESLKIAGEAAAKRASANEKRVRAMPHRTKEQQASHSSHSRRQLYKVRSLLR